MILTALFTDRSSSDFSTSLHQIISGFYDVLRVQGLLALQFVAQDGMLNGKPNEIRQLLNAHSLIKLEQAIREDNDLKDKYAEILLPSLRKIILIVHVLRQSSSAIDKALEAQVFTSILNNCTSNQQEIEFIKKFLQLTDETPLEKLLVDSVTEEGHLQSSLVSEHVPASLKQFHNPDFYLSHINEFADWICANKAQDKTLRVEMPNALLLLTPYFTFGFKPLPDRFSDLQIKAIKMPCVYCGNSQLKSCAVCLLCGENMCFSPGCLEKGLGGHGQLSQHTIQEGGQCVFMVAESGSFLCIGNNLACAMSDSPYRNRFGEIISLKNTIDQVDYEINNEGGGQKCLEQMTKSFQGFEMTNNILQLRTNPDSRYRIFMRDLL